ncbi:hypothetical protein L6452_03327 [Arctium lappa]|uniref:Uncharacterized protein n=1 Tax=Arctium lappa TaxID=4217 RepID=A0ACB9FMX2_ARCLA|nr:hypothetical protein L6452_03327 [Arctium lappa]
MPLADESLLDSIMNLSQDSFSDREDSMITRLLDGQISDVDRSINLVVFLNASVHSHMASDVVNVLVEVEGCSIRCPHPPGHGIKRPRKATAMEQGVCGGRIRHGDPQGKRWRCKGLGHVI